MSRLSYIIRKLDWLPLVNFRIGFPLTLRHYYYFGSIADQLEKGELTSAASWDTLRLHHPRFVIYQNRDEWLGSFSKDKDGQDLAIKARAVDIVQWCRDNRINNLHSVGVGSAALEYFIKSEDPSIRLIASDFNLEGVTRLKRVFTECDQITLFNVLTDDWSKLQPQSGESAVLMYRVDTSFTDEQWRMIFTRMTLSNVRHIIYIPATIMSVQYLIFMMMRHVWSRIRGRKMTFTGYVRSGEVFPKLWLDKFCYQQLKLGGLPSYWLTKVKGNNK